MLKHLKHENVHALKTLILSRSDENRSWIWSISSYPLWKTCVLFHIYEDKLMPINYMRSYLITDLMETDLKTMLGSRSIGNEFVQYFLYQIMVWLITNTWWYITDQAFSADWNMLIQRGWYTRLWNQVKSW
jgi:hypothetical protein